MSQEMPCIQTLRSGFFKLVLENLEEGHSKDSIVESLTDLAVNLNFDWTETPEKSWYEMSYLVSDCFQNRLEYEREMMRERILKDRALEDNSSNVVQFKPKSEDWDDIPF